MDRTTALCSGDVGRVDLKSCTGHCVLSPNFQNAGNKVCYDPASSVRVTASWFTWIPDRRIVAANTRHVHPDHMSRGMMAVHSCEPATILFPGMMRRFLSGRWSTGWPQDNRWGNKVKGDGTLRCCGRSMEEGSGLWNLAFLTSGAEIIALSLEKGPPLHQPPLSSSLLRYSVDSMMLSVTASYKEFLVYKFKF